MPGKSYSAMLKDLCKDYYNHRIGFEEYRSQRSEMLDRIDAKFNHACNAKRAEIVQNGREENIRLGDTTAFQVKELEKLLANKTKKR